MAAGPGRFLIVDPESSRREAIAGPLRRAGLEVTPTGSGREALRLARQASGPALVLIAGVPADLPAAELADAGAAAGLEVVDLTGGRGPEAARALAAFRSMGEAVGLLDRRGEFIVANPAMERLLSATSGSLVAWVASGRRSGGEWPLPRALRSGRREVEEWTSGRRRVRVAVEPLPEPGPDGAAAIMTVFELPTPRLAQPSSPAEAREAEERIAQLEHEARLLRQFTGGGRQVDAAEPLRSRNPAGFCLVVERYERIMDQVVEQRSYRVDHHTAEGLRALAEYLGSLGAGPRDVIEVHSTALRRKSASGAATRAQVYAAEGRIMVLELMGNLVAFYRPPMAVAPGGPADDVAASPHSNV